MIQINGNRVYLKKLVENATAEFFELHLNDEVMTRFMLYVPYPYTREDGVRFMKFLEKTDKEHSTLEMAVFEKATGKMIGVASFAHLDFEHCHGEIGYWISRAYQGQGIASEAVKLLLTYGFETLNLERIYAHVDIENAASIRVLEKCGFTREGVLRKAAKHRGHFIDRCVYALIRSERDRA